MKLKHLLFALVAITLSSCVGKPIDENVSQYYKKGWGTIYFTDKPAKTMGIYAKKVKGADTKTFVPLAEFVAKDKKMVYYQDIPQPHIDAESFLVKEDGTMKDKNHVYFPALEDASYKLKILYNVDLESYGSYKGHIGWGYDKNHVYQGYSKPVEADPASFTFLSENFMKDKDFLYIPYFGGIKKLEIKTDSLIALGKSYIRGKDQVYFFDFKKTNDFGSIPFYSADSISVLDDPFIIINNKVYDNGQLLNDGNVDAATFRILDGYYSRDTSYIFYSGQAIPADIKSFELLQEGFAKDQYSVYYLGYKLSGVDVQSFKIVNSLYFLDKSHVYFIHSVPRDKQEFFIIIDNANPKTFYCNPNKDELYGADDKNEFYNGGAIVKNP